MTEREASGLDGGVRIGGAAVYPLRDGKLLMLRRSDLGMWAAPQGALDPGERPEEAAVRELLEETRLVPDGPLTLVGLYPVEALPGRPWVASYVCECAVGDVVLNGEHTEFRWFDPAEFRAGAGERLAAAEAASPALGALAREIYADLGRLLDWLALRSSAGS